MDDQVTTQLSGENYGTAGPWYPLRKWRSCQDAGLLPLLESGAPRRMDWLQRSLAACYWPGYSAAPLFVPYISGSLHHPGPGTSPEQYKWRVSLDVAHFCPSEISLSVKDGFLQVRGSHEEKPDEHGYIARCFTRKYRLPAEIDATTIVSSLSVDGILTVEAPVPEASIPATIVIPIKVEMEATEELHEAETPSDKAPDRCTEVPDAPAVEDQAELHGEQTHCDSTDTGLQQDEEKREEETPEKAAEESHPPVSEDSKVSSKDHEVSESQQSPDTTAQSEHKGAEEAGSEGAAEEEITQPEKHEVGMSPTAFSSSQETE